MPCSRQPLAWDTELTKKFQPVHDATTGLASFAAQSSPVDELITFIQPKDEQTRKIMYNQYIHWSSAVATEGVFAPFALVGLGQINHATSQFERTFYHG